MTFDWVVERRSANGVRAAYVEQMGARVANLMHSLADRGWFTPAA